LYTDGKNGVWMEDKREGELVIIILFGQKVFSLFYIFAGVCMAGTLTAMENWLKSCGVEDRIYIL
jgi:hypothetical protein